MEFVTITPIEPLAPLKPMEKLPAFGAESWQPNAGSDFGKFLMDAVRQVDALQKQADVASVKLAIGQGEDLAAAMIAMEKASLSLSLLVTARDRAIDAYNQIARMQL